MIAPCRALARFRHRQKIALKRRDRSVTITIGKPKSGLARINVNGSPMRDLRQQNADAGWAQAHLAMMGWINEALARTPMEPYDIRRVYDDPPNPWWNPGQKP